MRGCEATSRAPLQTMRTVSLSEFKPSWALKRLIKSASWTKLTRVYLQMHSENGPPLPVDLQLRLSHYLPILPPICLLHMHISSCSRLLPLNTIICCLRGSEPTLISRPLDMGSCASPVAHPGNSSTSFRSFNPPRNCNTKLTYKHDYD